MAAEIESCEAAIADGEFFAGYKWQCKYGPKPETKSALFRRFELLKSGRGGTC